MNQLKYLNITATIESKAMIKKILLTTAEVVAWPTAAAPPLTRNPLKQPIQDMRSAKTPLLMIPKKISKRPNVLNVCKRYAFAVKSSMKTPTISPPNMAKTSENKVRMGTTITEAKI